jgi:hypothetical protein
VIEVLSVDSRNPPVDGARSASRTAASMTPPWQTTRIVASAWESTRLRIAAPIR